MTTRLEIIECARELKGRPFVFAGRTAGGVDCVGIPLLISKRLQITGWQKFWQDPECHAYARVRGAGFLSGKLDAFVDAELLRRIDKNRLQPGDFPLCWTGFQKDQHVALITGQTSVLHATNRPTRKFPRGRIIETAITPQIWRSFLWGYQFVEVK